MYFVTKNYQLKSDCVLDQEPELDLWWTRGNTMSARHVCHMFLELFH